MNFHDLYFVIQSVRLWLLNSVQRIILFGFALPDNLIQQVNVLGEGFTAGRCEDAGSQRAVVLVRFGYGDEAFLLKRADVGGEIAVGHIQHVAQFGKGEFWRGGKGGHDGQPPLLVNHTVELEE